jgi:uncharacterized membrane protein YeaQ/YmgE (transglycosylase-associated protein family)
MVNYLAWIILGAIMGWLASLIQLPNGHRDVRIDIAVGIIGAFVAGLVFTPLFSPSPINQSNLSLPALQVSLLGPSFCWGSSSSFADLRRAQPNA